MKRTEKSDPPASARSSQVEFLSPPTKEEKVLEEVQEALREFREPQSHADREISSRPQPPQNHFLPQSSIRGSKQQQTSSVKSVDRIEAEKEKELGLNPGVILPTKIQVDDPAKKGYEKLIEEAKEKQKEKSFGTRVKKAFSLIKNGCIKFADMIAKSFGLETFTEKSSRKKSEKDKKTVNKESARFQTQTQAKTEPSQEYAPSQPKVFFETPRRSGPQVIISDGKENLPTAQKHAERFGALARERQRRIDARAQKLQGCEDNTPRR